MNESLASVNHKQIGYRIKEVREHRKQRHVLRFPAAAESRGDRREPVMQDRVLQDLHSGQAAASYSHQSQEIIHSR